MIQGTNFNLNNSGTFDATVNALLRLPEYKGYTKQQIVDYIDKVGVVESGGKNIYQKGTTKHGSGYYQIEDDSMGFSTEWLKKISEQSGVPIPIPKSKKAIYLSKDEQMALTLAHGYGQAIGHKTKMNFNDPKNTWLDTHWVGKRDNTYEATRAKRAQQWDKYVDHEAIKAQRQWPVGKQMSNAEAYSTLLFNPNKAVSSNSDKYSSLILKK